MPQPTQHSLLIHVLLLWITLLSIIQAVFIIFFFTAGHHLSQNSSTVTPEGTVQPQANITPSPSPDQHLLEKVQMITYKARQDNDGYKWELFSQSQSLVSKSGKDLQIKKDGNYFLILQVTLKTCRCSYNGTRETTRECTVSVKRNNEVILQGWINTNTCSTGLLGKVEPLHAGGKLEFELPKTEIDEQKHLTHLDIIYMDNQ